jgi:peptidoglycan/xylan/chitin deacetylase (PgdA/CDA1 family)
MSDSSVHKPWKPTPLVSGSVALHVAAIAASVLRPHVWPWALGAVVVDHLLLAASGLWPRSTLLGPNWTRLPEGAATRSAVAITVDDGPDPEITPQVLALLEAHGAKATFFCIGEKVQRHPELARDIVREGHAIENHSQRHLHNFSLLGPRGIAREVGRAQESITDVIGVRPMFFRAPAGLRNPFLDPVLTHHGLQLASWTRRGFDTVNRNGDRVFGKLTRNLRGGDILLLHDGHAARTRSGHPVIIEVLPHLLAALAAARLRPITLRSALT